MSDPGSSPVIVAEGISKRYHVSMAKGAGRLVDRVGEMVRHRPNGSSTEVDLWALKDVSFSVPRGEVVGVLGRNGSGKTTLMKVLARVTAPTTGRAVVRGRIGAIFQMGMGFHPELSGRENVMLSGALMGVDQSRMREAYPDILDFADIGEFIEAPVKQYSSGMYVRLAFAVTTTLEADVLVIDEALSVGDARFQDKCRARILDLVGGGNTVIMVSHSNAAIRELCDRAMVFERGELVFEGAPEPALDFYSELNAKLSDAKAGGTT